MATLLGCWSRAVKSVGSETSSVAPEQAEGSEGEDDVDDLVTKGMRLKVLLIEWKTKRYVTWPIVDGSMPS